MAYLGSVPSHKFLVDASSTNITASSGNPLELEDILTEDVTSIEIHNGTGATLALYAGPNTNLELLCYIPGYTSTMQFLERQPISLSKGQRLSVRNTADAEVTAGNVIINCWV